MIQVLNRNFSTGLYVESVLGNPLAPESSQRLTAPASTRNSYFLILADSVRTQLTLTTKEANLFRKLIFEKPKPIEKGKVTSRYPVVRTNKLGQKFLFYSANNYKEIRT